MFVIGCATGGVAAQFVVPSVRAGTTPTRWEYQCAVINSEETVVPMTLNRLGAEGWELVSIAPQGGSAYVRAYTVCAKRALP